MKTTTAVVCLAMLAFLPMAPQALAQHAQDINGKWSNYLDMGLGISTDGKCVYRQFEERRYSILANPPNAWTGLYTNILHTRWVQTNRDNCALMGVPQQGLYIQIRSWSVDIRMTGPERYSVAATFYNCTGLPCYSGAVRDNFVTTLTLMNGELRDVTADSTELPPLSFYPRDATVARATIIAEKFMTSWSASLRGVNGLDLGIALLDPETLGRQEWRRAMVRNYVTTRMDKSVNFSVVEAYLLKNAANEFTTPLILHFTVRHYQSTGENFGETYELVERDGKWRLMGLRF